MCVSLSIHMPNWNCTHVMLKRTNIGLRHTNAKLKRTDTDRNVHVPI